MIPEINADSGVSRSANGPLGGTGLTVEFKSSSQPAPHTDTAHTTERESSQAPQSVCLCKGHPYKELEEFGHQPETVGGAEQKTDS